MLVVVTFAYAKSKVVLSTPGRLYNLTATIQTPGTYYLVVLDAATAPADATDITVAAYTPIAYLPLVTSAAHESRTLDFTVPGTAQAASGIRCNVGCVVLLSSTAAASITGSANLIVNAGFEGST